MMSWQVGGESPRRSVMDRRASQALVIALAVAAIVFVWLAQTHKDDQPDGRPVVEGQADSSVHLALGNPSAATDDPAVPDNFLMRKGYYALSYNNTKGTPNWVSWRLQQSDLGPAPRAQFYPDPDLPRTFKHVVPHDYTETGFDRGHMCPRGDRTSTPEAATATFAMTNIIPQAPHVNQKAWADFEDYCREMVIKHHDVLYIVSGPEGRGGEGSKGPTETIAHGKVTVPAKCWKVVAVVDGGEGDAADVAKIGPRTRLIGVVMPNDQSVGHGWAKFRVSVRDVETLTGYQFFDRVPAEIIDPLKAVVDTEHVAPSRPRRTGD
jgi:endonuclease G